MHAPTSCFCKRHCAFSISLRSAARCMNFMPMILLDSAGFLLSAMVLEHVVSVPCLLEAQLLTRAQCMTPQGLFVDAGSSFACCCWLLLGLVLQMTIKFLGKIKLQGRTTKSVRRRNSMGFKLQADPHSDLTCKICMMASVEDQAER